MADVIIADCDLAELLVALGIADQPHTVSIPDEPRLLIQSLARHGVSATSAPWNDPDTSWEHHRVCVLKRTWTHTLRPDAFLAWAYHVSRQCVLVNPWDVLVWNLHKRYLLELAARGVPIMPTELVTPADARPIREVVAGRGWSDIIVKPAIAAGSIGIGHFAAADETAQAHAERLLRAGDVLVQPFATQIQQRGEISLVFINRQFSHALHKQPVPGDYRAQPHLGIELVECDPTDTHLAIAAMALAVVPNWPLSARVDLVDYDDSPVLTEVELIDPYLFLDRVPAGLERFTQAIVQQLAGA